MVKKVAELTRWQLFCPNFTILLRTHLARSYTKCPRYYKQTLLEKVMMLATFQNDSVSQICNP
jgi:hypothetical protein